MTQPLRPPVSAGNNSADSRSEVKAPPNTANWGPELGKFLYQAVEVEYLVGDQSHKITGKLVAFKWDALHVIVDTESTTVVVRLPLSITRLRKGAKIAA